MRIGFIKPSPHAALLSWRVAELTSERNRKILAGSLARIIRELERPPLISGVPLNRTGLAPNLHLLRALTDRLAEPRRPVAARGMLLVEELLTDGFKSPLYLGGRSTDIPDAFGRCLAALEPAEGAMDVSARRSTGRRSRLEISLRQLQHPLWQDTADV